MPPIVRHLVRGVLSGVCAVSVMSVPVLLAQPAALDRVEIRDRKDGSLKVLNGKLTLSKLGLQLVSGEKKAVLLSYEDILRIVPGELPGIDRAMFNTAFNAEEKKTVKDYEAARALYSEMLKKATDAAAKRQLEYRLAMIATRLADLEGHGERWKSLVEAALKEWDSFLINHTSGWEIWPAVRTAARLYVDVGRFDAAARLWSRVQKLSELPPDLLLEAAIQEADAHFRNKDYIAAQRVADAALKNAKPGPFLDRLQLYQTAAQEARNGLKEENLKKITGKIEERLDKLTDPLSRATAFGILGELYRQVPNHQREAMWAFLWVETVYNVDKYETHKAAVRLVEIFQAFKDEERAQIQLDRLRQLRESL